MHIQTKYLLVFHVFYIGNGYKFANLHKQRDGEHLERKTGGILGRVEEPDGVKRRLTAQILWRLVMLCENSGLNRIRGWSPMKSGTWQFTNVTGLVQFFSSCRSQLKCSFSGVRNSRIKEAICSN